MMIMIMKTSGSVQTAHKGNCRQHTRHVYAKLVDMGLLRLVGALKF